MKGTSKSWVKSIAISTFEINEAYIRPKLDERKNVQFMMIIIFQNYSHDEIPIPVTQ